MPRTSLNGKKVADEKIADAGFENPGLCSTCDSSLACVYRANQDRAVNQCEEYVSYEPAPVKVEDERRQHISIVEEKSGRTSGPSTLRGLCMNCDKRESCSFPKPDEGIWHCEEYE